MISVWLFGMWREDRDVRSWVKAEIVGESGESGDHREDESRNCWRKQEKWCSWRG